MLSIFLSKQSNKVIQLSNSEMSEYNLKPRSFFHSYREDLGISHEKARQYVKALYEDAEEVDDSFITL